MRRVLPGASTPRSAGPRGGGRLAGLVLLALALGPAPAPSGARTGLAFDQGRGIRECAMIRGRLDDPMEEARAIRQAPAEDSRVLGWIPAPGDAPDARRNRSFAVVSTHDGWLQIADHAATPSGWISGRGVSTDVRAAQGHSHPERRSEIVLRSTDGQRIDRHAELIDIIACDGAWIFGRWRIDAPTKLIYRPELEIWTGPAVVEIWTPACDRREPGCETDEREGSRPAGPRDPLPRR